MTMIRVTPADRRALRLPWSALAKNKAHEFWTKARGQRIKGQGMIAAQGATVAAGFGALQGDDFHEYNLPQAWVERRQIPTAIDRRIPAHAAVVLDLGCGPGTSTEVLCHFANPTWTILGFDFTPHLIEAAIARDAREEFRNRTGEVIHPRFTCQSIADPLLDQGHPVPAASVDFAISGGVVGLYLHEPQVKSLLTELCRVVKPHGHIALDAGPSIPAPTLRRLAEEAGFIYEAKARSFWIEPRPKLIFRLAP